MIRAIWHWLIGRTEPWNYTSAIRGWQAETPLTAKLPKIQPLKAKKVPPEKSNVAPFTKRLL